MNKSRRHIGYLAYACYAWVLISVSLASEALAATPAGTLISNIAIVNYTISGTPQTPMASLAANVLVDEVIQPVLTCQSLPNVAVNSPGINDVLTYLLTNGGNGSESFSIARTNGPLPLPAGNYTPINSIAYDPLNTPTGAIFLETNNVAGFQPGADLAYVSGVNDPVIAAGKGLAVYVLSDTSNVPANAQGDVLLTVTSRTVGAAGAAVATRLLGVGDNLGNGAGNAIVVTPRAEAAATCSYIATGLGFVMNKSVLSVADPLGGVLLMPGAVMTYQITVSLNGVGTATGLVVSDPIPANLTYVPGSIAVGGVAMTDAVDADSAQFATNTVSVSLGNVAAPASVVITFRATIN